MLFIFNETHKNQQQQQQNINSHGKQSSDCWQVLLRGNNLDSFAKGK